MSENGDPLFQYSEQTPGEWRGRVIGPWDDGARAEMKRGLNTPERRALAVRLREVSQLGEPAYAIADGDLGGGAVAMVIRDPEAGRLSRLIVFGSSTLSDEVIACARGALVQSEVSEWRVSHRRVITLWLDGQYEAREGARQAVGRRDWKGPSRATGVANRLRTAAELAPIVAIPEIGDVRVIVPTKPEPESTAR